MRAVTMLLFASACALPVDDYDRDGWAAPEDCDDFAPDVHPGAEDLLGDGINQDCEGDDIVQREFGREHTCALDAGGLVRCEGDPSDGKLEVPMPSVGAVFVEIAAGDWHTCALDTSKWVSCWGDDTYG